ERPAGDLVERDPAAEALGAVGGGLARLGAGAGRGVIRARLEEAHVAVAAVGVGLAVGAAHAGARVLVLTAGRVVAHLAVGAEEALAADRHPLVDRQIV